MDESARLLTVVFIFFFFGCLISNIYLCAFMKTSFLFLYINISDFINYSDVYMKTLLIRNMGTIVLRNYIIAFVEEDE